jgi:hypothetical protein
VEQLDMFDTAGCRRTPDDSTRAANAASVVVCAIADGMDGERQPARTRRPISKSDSIEQG